MDALTVDVTRFTEMDAWGREIQWERDNGRYYRRVIGDFVSGDDTQPRKEVSERQYAAAVQRVRSQ